MDDPLSREQRHREEMRAVEEAGGGVAEGFEQSEELLIEHASHGDLHSARVPAMEADTRSEEAGASDADTYGEADHEQSSEDEA
jgi:hypothetical protein